MGYKNLEVYFQKNTMVIHYTKELEDLHKSKLNVDEIKFGQQAKEIAEQVKWIKGFKKCSIGFGQIDWYDSCNEYDVPAFICSLDNKRKVETRYWSCNDIPKGWTICYTLRLDIPSSLRGVNKFFKALKISVSDKHLNEIKKAIKLNKAYTIEM